MNKELKLTVGVVGGIVLGFLTTYFLASIILGTVFGLTWGYSDHVLVSGNKNKVKSVKKSSKRKR